MPCLPPGAHRRPQPAVHRLKRCPALRRGLFGGLRLREAHKVYPHSQPVLRGVEPKTFVYYNGASDATLDWDSRMESLIGALSQEALEGPVTRPSWGARGRKTFLRPRLLGDAPGPGRQPHPRGARHQPGPRAARRGVDARCFLEHLLQPALALMAVPAYFFVEVYRPLLPYGLGFAAGAIICMVFPELAPGLSLRATCSSGPIRVGVPRRSRWASGVCSSTSAVVLCRPPEPTARGARGFPHGALPPCTQPHPRAYPHLGALGGTRRGREPIAARRRPGHHRPGGGSAAPDSSMPAKRIGSPPVKPRVIG